MKKITWLVVLLLVLVVISVWAFYPLWIYAYRNLFFNSRLVELGVFGDSYGALNTLFSGLAFTGIIISIFLQSQELSETRRDINRQTKEFESQTFALKKQVFENTFFQLLVVFKSTADNVYVRLRDDEGQVVNTIVGRQAFSTLFKDELSYLYSFGDIDAPVKVIREKYASFDGRYGTSVGPYCRTLYQILKMIDDSDMGDVDKKTYSNILRAQLSLHELSVLFFCGLSAFGDGTFKAYLEKYEFFEHLPIDFYPVRPSQVDIKDIVVLYDIKAYGKTNVAAHNLFFPK